MLQCVREALGENLASFDSFDCTARIRGKAGFENTDMIKYSQLPALTFSLIIWMLCTAERKTPDGHL